MATGYISGSVGELYVNRFYQAGSRHNGDPPATCIDPNLDPYIRAEVSWTIYELEPKANVIKEFIKELGIRPVMVRRGGQAGRFLFFQISKLASSQRQHLSGDKRSSWGQEKIYRPGDVFGGTESS